MKRIVTFSLGILFATTFMLLASCGDKDNNDIPTPADTTPADTIPQPADLSDNPYFIVDLDSVSILTGDSTIVGHYAATCRFVEDTAFYYLMIAKEITGTGVRRPAVTLDLRYDTVNHWQMVRAAMYENFDHASALTEANNGQITFDWLSAKTLRSIVDGYNRETNTLSLVIECDMFNLYELYFGGEGTTIDQVRHKTVVIGLTDVMFSPLGF